MKQQNRVQLSFLSILKIFGVYAIALDLFFACYYSVFYLIGSTTMSFTYFVAAMIVSPFLFVLLAAFGYPFFALLNRFRGGLLFNNSAR